MTDSEEPKSAEFNLTPQIDSFAALSCFKGTVPLRPPIDWKTPLNANSKANREFVVFAVDPKDGTQYFIERYPGMNYHFSHPPVVLFIALARLFEEASRYSDPQAREVMMGPPAKDPVISSIMVSMSPGMAGKKDPK